jgi:hypothetical protein
MNKREMAKKMRALSCSRLRVKVFNGKGNEAKLSWKIRVEKKALKIEFE